MSKKEDEDSLLWLSRENDHIHQKTVAEENEPLLFGSGKIPLEGEVQHQQPPNKGGDVEEAPSNYGAIKECKEEDKASVASSSKGSKKKAAGKKKKTSPPQSIFDEDDGQGLDEGSSVGDDSGTALTLSTKPHMPNRNWCIEFFRAVSAVTGIASLGLLATQMIPLFFAPLRSQDYFEMSLKIYLSLFCFLILLVECDAPIPFIRNSQILQTFFSRGFLYSFLGLICLEESYSERVKNIVSTHSDEFHVAWASLFMQISSWLIFACGDWYMLMGLCCMKKWRDRIRKKDKEVWTKYRKELREWKRLNWLGLIFMSLYWIHKCKPLVANRL